MEFYTFFVFFSVIVTPEGEIKTFAKNVIECPSAEIVMELHKPRLDRGEIIDWSAACLTTKLPLDTTVKGLKT